MGEMSRVSSVGIFVKCKHADTPRLANSHFSIRVTFRSLPVSASEFLVFELLNWNFRYYCVTWNPSDTRLCGDIRCMGPGLSVVHRVSNQGRQFVGK